jgi:hypothetical protein
MNDFDDEIFLAFALLTGVIQPYIYISIVELLLF